MMTHDYYRYSADELIYGHPKIPVTIMKDNDAVFCSMADEMADTIIHHNVLGERTVFICPVGPVGQYPYFVKRVNSEGISLANVWFFNMDEYLDDDMEWIDPGHPLSFRGFMQREVYGKIDPALLMPEDHRIFPDPKDPGHIPELIEKLGGVDICFGGIGINGHVAFNEADASATNEEFLERTTRVLAITPETRTANAIGDFNGALEDMPNYCVTIGMKEISRARSIRLGCFRNWHRAVVRRAAYGDATSAFPVTLLQTHPDISIRITEFAAGKDEI